jgi:transcriptional regulator GlxA family with amidase domain
MMDNFAKPIMLEHICDEACISKFHLLRSFKSFYGVTPYQYLTFVRLGKAKELLRAGFSAEATSCSVGFESVTSFAKFFKKATRMRPGTYRLKSKSAILDSFSFVPFPIFE